MPIAFPYSRGYAVQTDGLCFNAWSPQTRPDRYAAAGRLPRGQLPRKGTIQDVPWFALVMGLCLVLGLVVPRWRLLPAIASVLNPGVHTPSPDDDVARAAWSIAPLLSTTALAAASAAGRLDRQRGDLRWDKPERE